MKKSWFLFQVFLCHIFYQKISICSRLYQMFFLFLHFHYYNLIIYFYLFFFWNLTFFPMNLKNHVPPVSDVIIRLILVYIRCIHFLLTLDFKTYLTMSMDASQFLLSVFDSSHNHSRSSSRSNPYFLTKTSRTNPSTIES